MFLGLYCNKDETVKIVSEYKHEVLGERVCFKSITDQSNGFSEMSAKQFLQIYQPIDEEPVDSKDILHEISKLLNRCRDHHGVYVDFDTGNKDNECYLISRGCFEKLGTGKITFESEKP